MLETDALVADEDTFHELSLLNQAVFLFMVNRGEAILLSRSHEKKKSVKKVPGFPGTRGKNTHAWAERSSGHTGGSVSE